MVLPSVAHVGADSHVEHFAGDEGGQVRGQEGHRLGDVGRPGRSPNGPVVLAPMLDRPADS